MELVKKAELLAPAGNMECLKTAFYFGADAVYFAGRNYGLRAFAQNFDIDEIRDAVKYAHDIKKRVYITVNAIFRNSDFDGFDEYIKELYKAGIDAVIISDPGVLSRIKRVAPGLEIHLSTQCSTSNYESANFWHSQGIKRIVLSRELSLEDICGIKANAPDSLELEVFVHGAMCVAYSGRCLLSSVFTGRSGNKGECAQPCRWEYTISEAGYPGEEFPIMEDERGTYVLNSKDLMMLDHLPELLETGVDSLKIEGRMKSAFYVATVVNAYRRALDAYYENPSGYTTDDRLIDELNKSATRRFTTGFFFGNPKHDGQDIEKDYVKRGYIFVAVVRESTDDGVIVEQRGKFSVGEKLGILSPSMDTLYFEVKSIVNERGEEQESAPHAQQIVKINCPYELHPGDILRKII